MSRLQHKLPSYDQLRHRTQSLLKQFHTRDLRAATLFQAHHPSFKGLTPSQVFSKSIQLSDAQLVIAREHGFSTWHEIKGQTTSSVPRGKALSAVGIDQGKIRDREYRLKLGAQLGLPAVDSIHVSQHGVEYSIIDHSFVLSMAGASRGNTEGRLTWHTDELLPWIAPQNVSQRLADLFNQVNLCTGKDLIFFDTMPEAHSGHLPPGLNCAVEMNSESRCWMIYLDAARMHETIIAHELGHIRIAIIDECEDYRHLRDTSDLRKVTQFQHLQSFVLDLKVNDFIEELGFDMSIISEHQLESVKTIAMQCERGNPIRTKHAAAGIVKAIAAVMLEKKRLPESDLLELNACLNKIKAGLPEVYGLAEKCVAIVAKHGYSDSASVRKVVDECAVLLFQATGDDFDLERDLRVVPPVDGIQDKRPDFLPGFPVAVKLDVLRTAARHKIGPKFGCNVITSPSGMTVIKLFDLSGRSSATPEVVCDLPQHLIDQMHPPQSRQPRQLPLMPAPPIPHLNVPAYMPRPSTKVQMAMPSFPIVPSLPWQAGHTQAYQSGFSSTRNYMAGVGLWLSRAGFDNQEMGEHPYGYAENNPIVYTDPSGSYPTVICPSNPTRQTDLTNAVNQVCAALISAGTAGLNTSKCLNQPGQAQCMINWCNDPKSTVSCGNLNECKNLAPPGHVTCAYSHGTSGPGSGVYVCPGNWDNPGCKKWANCSSATTGNILHEVAGLCGSPHSGGGSTYPDPCDFRANCLCNRISGL